MPSPISHNAPFWNRNVHVCTFLLQKWCIVGYLSNALGALWDESIAVTYQWLGARLWNLQWVSRKPLICSLQCHFWTGISKCIGELCHRCSFRQWLVTYSVTSHYLNQCWFDVNLTLQNKLQWNLNKNVVVYIQGNTTPTAMLSTICCVDILVIVESVIPLPAVSEHSLLVKAPLLGFTISQMSQTGGHDVVVARHNCGISMTLQTSYVCNHHSSAILIDKTWHHMAQFLFI